jgi:hypothetical protein
MRIPESMLCDFILAKVGGGTSIHAKRIGESKALCGREITNWLESPGQPEWLVCSDTTEITCPRCIKFCEEHKAVKITQDDAERIFHLAAFADSEGQLGSEDRPVLLKLRDAYPEVAKRYPYLIGVDE